MTGFEKTKFVSLPESMEEELTCAICLNILNAPMTAPCCRTSYCRKCIEHYLLKSDNSCPTCPSCRASLTTANLQPLPVFVNNILNKLEVFCDNDINGCTQILKLGELSQHLTGCPFDPNSSTLKCLNAKELYDNQKEMVKICSADNLNNSRQLSATPSTGGHSQPHKNKKLNFLIIFFVILLIFIILNILANILASSKIK